MKILSSCSVPTIGESVTLSLAHGDLLSEVTTNDTVVASVFKRSYDTGFFQGTFIGALEDKYKIRFEELSKSPKIDFRSGLSTWATIVDAGPTVIVIEFAPEIDLTETFLNLAVSLEVMLRKRWLPTPARVLMPILGSGAQRIPVSSVAPVLLRAASQGFAQLAGIQQIVVMDRELIRIQEFQTSWDEILGRRRSALLEGPLATSTIMELNNIHSSLRLAELDQFGWITELFSLINTDSVTSNTLPALCRKICESMVRSWWAQKSPKRKSNGLADDVEDLKNIGVAQWSIGYLHALRQFGNYGSHINDASDTVPSAMDHRDLLLCLQCIRSVIPVWHSCLANGPSISLDSSERV